MGLFSTTIRTPDYGQNGVVTVSATPTGTNTALDVLSVSNAKDWMKVESAGDDALITSLISEIIDSVFCM